MKNKLKQTIYIRKEILSCPECGFEQPEKEDNMPNAVDIITWNYDTYLCGNCNCEFKQ
jgi:hypothetical protein